MPNPYQSSGDTGVSNGGVSVLSHMTGNPLDNGPMSGTGATAGHTWVIIIGALGVLYLMGYGFKSIRF